MVHHLAFAVVACLATARCTQTTKHRMNAQCDTIRQRRFKPSNREAKSTNRRRGDHVRPTGLFLASLKRNNRHGVDHERAARGHGCEL